MEFIDGMMNNLTRSGIFDGSKWPMLLFDVLSFALGVFLIINPKLAYQMGRGRSAVAPPSWLIIGRIIGLALMILGVLFFIADF